MPRRVLMAGSARKIAGALSVVSLCAALSATAWGAEFTGRVVAVLDGEEITVEHEGRTDRIRLHGVECPDKDRRLARRARQHLSKLVLGQTVTVVPLEPDMEDRLISDVFLSNGEMLNAAVIRAGFAWTDGTAYGLFSELEDEARTAGRGMWAPRARRPEPSARPPGQPKLPSRPFLR